MKTPYRKRQAAWIKRHNIKLGSRVLVLRAWPDDEGESLWSWLASDSELVGKECIVYSFDPDAICVELADESRHGTYAPYFALKVVK